jgi:hypothetical protein
MFFWFFASPLWWLLGLPGIGAFGANLGTFSPSMFLLEPGLVSMVAMGVVLAGAGLLGRRALNY